jgi:DNA repair exonuclease SbcCD ATPase subunit
MKLNRLTLKNFKGVRSFSIEPQGKSITISGENATGKTTVFDAFRWLLDGKDSQNRKDFEIKTLERNGEPIHGLDHEVEAELDLGEGKTVTLKKRYKEEWTKKRGSATATFSGHTIDHHINGVPVKQKEYTEAIDEIAPAEVFLLLTDPRYFNTALHWTRRREILLEVCGDIPDADVIASDKKLARLPDVLGDRSIEEHRKVIAEKRKEIQKELDRIPVRIDEVTQGLPDIDDVDKAAHENNIKILSTLIEGKATEKIEIASGGRAATIKRRLSELKAEAQEKLTELRAGADERLQEALGKKSALSQKHREAENTVADLDNKIKRTEAAIKVYEKSLQELRDQWEAAEAETLAEPEIEAVCPTCGQDLPEDQVEEAREKALANHNQAKAARLEKITREGKETKAELQEATDELAIYQDQHEKAKIAAAAVLEEARALQQEITEIEQSRAAQEERPEYQKIMQKIQANQNELQSLQEENSDTVTNLNTEIAELTAQKAASEAELAKLEQVATGQARIEQLKEQERKLAREYEDIEQELFMTEEFIKAKVGLLEEHINSKFQFATFKLFETYISGGIEPVCETLYDGVPYGTSLNNGARINIGLDIIRTLSEHYKFEAPIFIDNAEAVTRIIDIPAQTIKLLVGPEKKLKVVEEEA